MLKKKRWRCYIDDKSNVPMVKRRKCAFQSKAIARSTTNAISQMRNERFVAYLLPLPVSAKGSHYCQGLHSFMWNPDLASALWTPAPGSHSQSITLAIVPCVTVWNGPQQATGFCSQLCLSSLCHRKFLLHSVPKSICPKQ